MPAKSKAQQRLFGMVHAYQKGELDNPSKTIKKIGDNISFKKAKKFASTKHKKLPEKVDESSIKQYIPDAVYIVCDGTSCYGCFGCDIEDEIRDNEVEVVKGPFAQWNDRVDELIEKMNDKMYEGKMTTTRLTESQLKKIVVESVKRVLNEVDWRTAHHAADIQSNWKYNGRRGGLDRYRKFRDYASDAANLKFFGQKGGVDFIRDSDNDEGVSWVGFNWGYPEVRINYRDKFGSECYIVPACVDYCPINPDTLCVIERFTDDGSSYYHGISNEDVRKYFGGEAELYQRFMEAVQEYTDLKNGKYRYDGKKGWHLKDK